MKVFTQHDVANSICSHEEVGQPWEERWSIDDHFKGLCTMDQVGSAKPIASEPEPEPEPIDAATQADIMETLVAGSVTPQTQAKFNKWADSNPGSYFPLLAKYNLARSMKDAPKPLPNLEDLTEEDVANLPSDQLKLILLKAAGITKKSELDALKG